MLPEVTLRNISKDEVKRYMDQGGEMSPELIFEVMNELLSDSENTMEIYSKRLKI